MNVYVYWWDEREQNISSMLLFLISFQMSSVVSIETGRQKGSKSERETERWGGGDIGIIQGEV